MVISGMNKITVVIIIIESLLLATIHANKPYPNTEHDDWDSQLGPEITMQMFKVFEKKIEKLEKTDKQLRESIGTLISTNVHLRIEMEEMSNRYTDLEKSLDDKTTILLKEIEELKKAVKEKDETGECQSGLRNNCKDAVKTIMEREETMASDDVEQSEHRKVEHSSGQDYPAFTAYLDKPATPTSTPAAVVFNKVLLNEGGMYDKTTGLFTAEIDGLYLFSWSASVTRNGDNSKLSVPMRLMVNEKHVVSVTSGDCQGSVDNQGSSVAVVKLTRGDWVWIHADVTEETSDVIINGDDDSRTTSFTGVLIHPVE